MRSPGKGDPGFCSFVGCFTRTVPSFCPQVVRRVVKWERDVREREEGVTERLLEDGVNQRETETERKFVIRF